MPAGALKGRLMTPDAVPASLISSPDPAVLTARDPAVLAARTAQDTAAPAAFLPDPAVLAVLDALDRVAPDPLVIASHLGHRSGAHVKVVVRASDATRLIGARLVPLGPVAAARLLASPPGVTWEPGSLAPRFDLAGLAPTDGRPRPLPVGSPEQVDGWSLGRFARIDLPQDLPVGAYRVEVDWCPEPGEETEPEGESGSASRAGEDGSASRAPAPVRVTTSAPFAVGPHEGPGRAMSDVMYYFKAMRSAGEIDRKDAHARLWGDGTGIEVDARGGWLDASGDPSKYLSHLTYTSTMSPQQTPLCAWAFLAAREELAGTMLGDLLDAPLRDEALWGADFLARFRSDQGWFYTAVFDGLTKKLEERMVSALLADGVRTDRYRAAFRQGAGLAIAALARASRCGDHGDFTSAEYLAAARTGFDHLAEHNTAYLFDGVESIVDDYCALLAAAELVAAEETDAGASRFRQAADARVRNLLDRYVPGIEGQPGHLVADGTGRPFFHCVESGLPVVALLRYAAVCDGPGRGGAAGGATPSEGTSNGEETSNGESAPSDAAGAGAGPDLPGRARELAVQLMADWVARTDRVANPFGHPRALVRPLGGQDREAFFFPHANETGYWWQGQNADLASIAHAARLTARLRQCPPDLAARLRTLATDCLDWVLGLNPFDVCMVQGRGRANVEYSPRWPNVPGGILNGITSGFDDEHDIAFMPAGPSLAGESWRWAEQWIPHAGWFVLAAASASAATAEPDGVAPVTP